MDNVFIIATEHQFLQVKQAISYFGFKANDYLVIFILQKEKDWAERVIKTYNITNFQFCYSWTFSKNIAAFGYKSRKYINDVTKLSRDIHVNRLFISQYSSDYSLLAYKILHPLNMILMDEGTASFNILNIRNHSRKISLKLLIKSFFYGMLLKYPESLIYFSQYKLNVKKEDRLISYDFNKASNVIDTFSENDAILLGSSLVEVNLVTEEYYFQIIRELISNFPSFKFRYYAHRKETKIKLDKIESFNITIVQSDLPFETEFGNFKIMPNIIFSFFSPILLNLYKMYSVVPEMKIIRFDTTILRINRQLVEEIYDAYEKEDSIEIIYLG